MKTEIKNFIKVVNTMSDEDIEKFMFYIVDKTQKIVVNRYRVYARKEDKKILNELGKQIK